MPLLACASGFSIEDDAAQVHLHLSSCNCFPSPAGEVSCCDYGELLIIPYHGRLGRSNELPERYIMRYISRWTLSVSAHQSNFLLALFLFPRHRFLIMQYASTLFHGPSHFFNEEASVFREVSSIPTLISTLEWHYDAVCFSRRLEAFASCSSISGRVC
jgi:hypothetical protein